MNTKQKIIAYTGREYEYVEAGWSELLRMLKDGEIDILGKLRTTDFIRCKLYEARKPLEIRAFANEGCILTVGRSRTADRNGRRGLYDGHYNTLAGARAKVL